MRLSQQLELNPPHLMEAEESLEEEDLYEYDHWDEVPYIDEEEVARAARRQEAKHYTHHTHASGRLRQAVQSLSKASARGDAAAARRIVQTEGFALLYLRLSELDGCTAMHNAAYKVGNILLSKYNRHFLKENDSQERSCSLLSRIP